MNGIKPPVSLKQISDINLTPLMDLTFILLITFIITFPLIEQGIPVNLPRGDAIPVDSDSEMRTLTLDAEGRFYIDDVPEELAGLGGIAGEWGVRTPDLRIFIRADESIAYGRVVEIMRILHQSGLTRLSLVTEPEGR